MLHENIHTALSSSALYIAGRCLDISLSSGTNVPVPHSCWWLLLTVGLWPTPRPVSTPPPRPASISPIYFCNLRFLQKNAYADFHENEGFFNNHFYPSDHWWAGRWLGIWLGTFFLSLSYTVSSPTALPPLRSRNCKLTAPDKRRVAKP